MKKKIDSLSDIRPLQVYFNRINAEPRSLKQAVVKEDRGRYWKDVATVDVSPTGEIRVGDPALEPTEVEIADIAKAFEEVEIPRSITVGSINGLPENVRSLERGVDLFVFKNVEKDIVMVQQRVEVEKPDGTKDKVYVPWSYYDDGKWRKSEPDGKLSLYGLERLKDEGTLKNTVFLHEGAKGAAVMDRIMFGTKKEDREAREGHPWAQELRQGIHLGWIGGALNPSRSDFSILAKHGVKRVFIVADNDREGKSAVSAISRYLKVPAFSIEFPDSFPKGFDLGDPFPATMFNNIETVKFYTGPSFRECLRPATWATDLEIPKNGGKPRIRIRDNFKAQWAYCDDADVYVNRELPSIRYSEKIFNKKISSFSHASRTSDYVDAAYDGDTVKLAYQPQHKTERNVIVDRKPAINLYEPTPIRPKEGDIDPWLEFTKYMFPDPFEAWEVLRWEATLIAREDIRMNYAMLWVSETQGIGKTIRANDVLAQLVGMHNTGFPSEDQIVNSSFNGWIAGKRLVVCNEIYSGHSWKAYNNLKGCITDVAITVNEKFEKAYIIENHSHIVACSNSKRALKMEDTDRRWLYPTVNEIPWSGEKFTKFRAWLKGGGLQIILHWARDFEQWAQPYVASLPEDQRSKFKTEYVHPKDRAPMTLVKQSLIEESRSDAQKEVIDLCRGVIDQNLKVAFAMKDVKGWLRGKVDGIIHDSDYELRKAAVSAGFKVFGERIRVGSQTQWVVLSPSAWQEEYGSTNVMTSEQRSAVRSLIRRPGDVAFDDM